MTFEERRQHYDLIAVYTVAKAHPNLFLVVRRATNGVRLVLINRVQMDVYIERCQIAHAFLNEFDVDLLIT